MSETKHVGRPKKIISDEDKENQRKLRAQKALERYHKLKEDNEWKQQYNEYRKLYQRERKLKFTSEYEEMKAKLRMYEQLANKEKNPQGIGVN